MHSTTKNINLNQPVQMKDPVNYVLSPFEGNKNPRYPQGIKIYLQATQDIYKEDDKLDISVSNAKDIIDHFIDPDNKYVWGRLAFMVDTGAVSQKIFQKV